MCNRLVLQAVTAGDHTGTLPVPVAYKVGRFCVESGGDLLYTTFTGLLLQNVPKGFPEETLLSYSNLRDGIG